MKIKEPCFVSRCEYTKSQHGGMMYDVRFKGLKTQDEYKTYVDEGNRNYTHWADVVTIAQNKDKGVIVDGLVLKNTKKGLVNADCQPNIKLVDDKQTIIEELNQHWNKGPLSDLFDEE